jgi:hypothetical protein
MHMQVLLECCYIYMDNLNHIFRRKVQQYKNETELMEE